MAVAGGIVGCVELDFGRLCDGELVAVIDAAVSALGDDRVRLDAPAQRLQLMVDAVRLDARLTAWRSLLAAQLERAEAAVQEHGTSTVTWLADAARLTRRSAGRLVLDGERLARFPIVAEAAAKGTVLPEHAQAITGVLDALPTDFDEQQLVEAQELMVGFADTHKASDLRSLSRYLLEVLDPDTAEAREADRLERDLRTARHNRHLTFDHDHHGSVRIRGSLPMTDAEAFITLVDSCHAHHIQPWLAGGTTALHNLVLVCPPPLHHRTQPPPTRRPLAGSGRRRAVPLNHGGRGLDKLDQRGSRHVRPAGVSTSSTNGGEAVRRDAPC